VTFWSGPGSADPYQLLTDPDQALFVSGFLSFLALLFEGIFTLVLYKKKGVKKSQIVEIKVFLHFFFLDGFSTGNSMYIVHFGEKLLEKY
jgi:hypothetical protein